MTLLCILLAIGFLILILGAEWLVKGSVSIAKRYKISELAIGLTIVAFGTSFPELLVNIVSSIKNYNDVTIGNIVGSNIFNLLFILGLSGVLFPLSVQSKTVWKEIPLSLLAAFLLFFMANGWKTNSSELLLGRIDGVFLLVFFIFFLYYILRSMRDTHDGPDAHVKVYKPVWSIVFIISGLAALILGSKLVVDKSVAIATFLGVSEKLIGLTIVSIGTSLPELVTSVVAAFRKRSDIAVGNVIGSNIFNIFFILGISSVIRPIKYNKQFNIDLGVLVISTLLFFIAMFSGRKYKLDRWEAGLLVSCYIVYIFYLGIHS